MRRWTFALLALLASVAIYVWLQREPGARSFSVDAPAQARASAADAPLANVANLAPPARQEAIAPAQPANALRNTPERARLHGLLKHASDDRPIAGAGVRMFRHGERHDATSDAAGHFEFEVGAGRWQLGGVPPPGFVPWCDALELASGEVRSYVRGMEQARELCLRVWQRDGGRVVPLEGARVRMINSSSSGFGHDASAELLEPAAVWTDAEGRTQVLHAENSPNLAIIDKQGFARSAIAMDFAPYLSSSPFESDGCVHAFLDRAGPRITGRVLDPDDEPLAGALVSAMAPFARERHDLDDYGPIDEQHLLGDRWPAPQASLLPVLARADGEGRFELASPDIDSGERSSYALVALPRRADLVHHHVQVLDTVMLGRAIEVEIRVARGWPVEIEFVNPKGEPIDGVASVRDGFGLAHAPFELDEAFTLSPFNPGRVFTTRSGQIHLLHPGGPARAGMSPRGQWDEREIEIQIPQAGERRVRIVLPPR